MLFWKRPVYSPLETAILDLLLRSLEPAAAGILSLQIKEKYSVLRYPPDHTSIEFFTRKGVIRHRFPADDEEVKFARLKFVDRQTGEGYTVEFWLVMGSFFSMDFKAGVKSIEKHSDLELKWFKLLRDPMLKPIVVPDSDEGKSGPSVDMARLAAWLGPLPAKIKLEEASPAASPAKRKSLLKKSPCFPKDYLEMVAIADGFSLTSLTVCGTEDVYHVSTEGGSRLVLASGSMGVLLLADEEPCGEVEYQVFSGTAQPVGTEFKEALQWMIREEAKWQ